jgi:hypothetical protein
MLGELLGEEKGKVTMHRVVRTHGKGHKMEITFQTTGTLAGAEMKDIGTYYSVMRPGGFLFGQGQGFIMTKDGDSISWVGQGTGKLKPGGGVSYRGAVYYETGSSKLARLNGIAVVYEHETDANDNCTTKYWEWK